MKATTNQKTVLGIAYREVPVKNFRGVTRVSFIATIGKTTYQVFSLERLKDTIKNHTEIDDSAAAQSFYSKLAYKGD